MTTPPVAMTSRWAGLLKRFSLAAIFLMVLVYLLPHQQIQEKWRAHPSQKPIEELELENGLHMPTEADIAPTGPMPISGFDQKIKEFETPMNSSEWGLMANQVKQLKDWAMELYKTIVVDPKHMNDALLTRFPYLKGSKMYRPWGYQPEEDRESLAKTGLIMCVGSRNFHLASHLIVNIRSVLGSKLPIEVAFAGDNDLKPEHREFMKGLVEDVTFIDLLQFFPSAVADLEGSGWAMKPFSVLASKHQHVILVDADAIFLADPAPIFGLNPDLKRTGTLFYHDRALPGSWPGLSFLKEQIAVTGNKTSEYLSKQSLWYSGDSGYEADSGVVAVDKSRPDIFIALVFTTWLNTKTVREEVTSKNFHGDKETFFIAMELLGVQYHFQPEYAGSMGKIRGVAPENPDTNVTEMCSTHMLHMDHSGLVPFWLNGGIYLHKDRPEKGFADFGHYWAGGPDKTSNAAWWWEAENTPCLKELHVKPVPQRMLDGLAQMYKNAAKIDEMIKQIPS